MPNFNRIFLHSLGSLNLPPKQNWASYCPQVIISPQPPNTALRSIADHMGVISDPGHGTHPEAIGQGKKCKE